MFPGTGARGLTRGNGGVAKRLKMGWPRRERIGVSLLPPATYTSLSRLLARIILAEWAHHVTILFVQEHVTVRAKILILRHSWSADREPSHDRLLCYSALYK